MPVSDKPRKKYGMGGSSRAQELTLPSLDDEGNHNVCLVRRPGVQGLIKAGILDDFDTLTSLVSTEIGKIEGRGVKPSDLVDLSKDMDKIKTAFGLIDQVVVYCVVQPEVLPVPDDAEEPRDPDALYVDEVDLDDKMFILDYAVGGSSDLDAFRKSTEAAVVGMADEQGVRDAS